MLPSEHGKRTTTEVLAWAGRPSWPACLVDAAGLTRLLLKHVHPPLQRTYALERRDHDGRRVWWQSPCPLRAASLVGHSNTDELAVISG